MPSLKALESLIAQYELANDCSSLLGHAKQIKQFRDWVVHRNPNKPAPSKTDPATAYRVFKDIITQVKGL